MKKSAAQMKKLTQKGIAKLQRHARQMERAILAWDKIHWSGDDFEPRRVIESMKKIARRLRKERP